MLNSTVENMFKHDGKTVKIIGKTRIKTYQDLYMQLSQLQKEKEIPIHSDYLGDNELAQTIYEKKYYLNPARSFSFSPILLFLLKNMHKKTACNRKCWSIYSC